MIVLRSPSSVLSSTVWILQEKRRFLAHTTVLQKQRLMLALARSINQVVASSMSAEGPGGGLLRSMVPVWLSGSWAWKYVQTTDRTARVCELLQYTRNKIRRLPSLCICVSAKALGNGRTTNVSLGVMKADAACVYKPLFLSCKAYSLGYRQQRKGRKYVVMIGEMARQGDHRSILPYVLAECTAVLCACLAVIFQQ